MVNNELLYEKTDEKFNIKILKAININNKKFTRHIHNSLCIGVVDYNHRIIEYNSHKTICEKNNIFIINPLEIHSCYVNNDLSQSYRVISIDNNLLKELKTDSLKIKSNNFFKIKIINNSDLLNRFNLLFITMENDKNEFEKESVIYSFINMLYDYSSIGNLTVSYTSVAEKAKRYIEKNYDNANLSLNDIARYVCLSKFHFHRIFTKNIGMSPYEYLIYMKINKAKGMLLKNKMTIIDVAYELGFFDQSHFTRYFKMFLGLTPGNFIKSNKIF